jgi:hypothetical protein
MQHITVSIHPIDASIMNQLMQIGIMRNGVQDCVCEIVIHQESGHIFAEYEGYTFEFHNINVQLDDVLNILNIEEDKLTLEWSEKQLSKGQILQMSVRDIGLTQASYNDY